MKINKIFDQIKKIPVDQKWIELDEESILGFMLAHPVRKNHAGRHQWSEGSEKNSFFNKLFAKPMPIAILMLVAILATGGGTAMAAQNSLPDESLYPMKIAMEKTQEALTFSAEKKAALVMKFADKRLDEIEKLQNRDQIKTSGLSRALENYKKNIESVQDYAEWQKTEPDQEALVAAYAEIDRRLVKQQNRLENMEKNASSSTSTKESLRSVKLSIMEKEKSLLTKIGKAGSISGARPDWVDNDQDKKIDLDDSNTDNSSKDKKLPVGEAEGLILHLKWRLEEAARELAAISLMINGLTDDSENGCRLNDGKIVDELKSLYAEMQKKLDAANSLYGQKKYIESLKSLNEFVQLKVTVKQDFHLNSRCVRIEIIELNQNAEIRRGE